MKIISGILISVLLLGVGCSSKNNTSIGSELDSSIQTGLAQNNKIANWKTFKSSKLGIEFKYPEKWQFEEEKDGITGNLNYQGDNYLQINILPKTEGIPKLELTKQHGKNLFAKNELNSQKEKLVVIDDYGTSHYYFISAYYDQGDKVYEFILSRPNHLTEISEVFETIISTVSFSNPRLTSN